MSFFQFEGPPCLQHSNYSFYKAFKYVTDAKKRILMIGDFFFLKLSEEFSVCIGEVELLWEDKASNQLLASLRLYFRPEHTPDGRQDECGEDEVLTLGERLVLRLDDLVPLIQNELKWTYGSTACRASGGGQRPVQQTNGVDAKPVEVKAEVTNGQLDSKVKVEEDNAGYLSHGAANVAVMSYAKYCRYRAVRRRLEGCENEWLHLALVVAIGGFAGRAPGCRVMFCKDTFYQSELDDLDIRMDHMLPVLKNRSKTKKIKQLVRKDSLHDSDSMEEMFANIAPSISTSSRPRRSADAADLSEAKVSTEEQDFLIGLHKFMHDSKMPIGRIPSLGFKQNLYYFYKQAEKLGGYDMITTKRMWKHLYDKLGGNSSNTSAATCTRKHYERLLLPYERHLRKVKGVKTKKKHKHGHVRANVDGAHKENVIIKAVDEAKEEITPLVHEKVEKVVDKSTPLAPIQPTEAEIDQNDQTDMPFEMKVKEADSPANHSNNTSSTEVLEVPVVKARLAETQKLPAASKGAEDQQLMRDHYTEMKNKPSTPAASSVSAANVGGPVVPTPTPLASVPGEGSVMPPYPNLMYRGGYLLPVLPPHIMQSQWASTAPSSAPGFHSLGEAAVSQTKELLNSAYLGRTPTKPEAASSSSSSRPESKASSSSSKKPSSAHSHKSVVSGQPAGPKAAHSNMPYSPAPYLLEDHIQPATRSMGPRATHDLLGHTSHSLAPLLHPTPPGHHPPTSLPPAPVTLYLHPSSTNPFAPLPSLLSEPPPTAHHQPRKRGYPFVDNAGSMGFPSMFPSPDMVLDSIRLSTGLPRNTPGGPRGPAVRQRFENPRDIFQQTPQTFPAAATTAAASTQQNPRKSSQPSLQDSNTSRMAATPKSKSSSSSYPSSSSLSSSTFSSSSAAAAVAAASASSSHPHRTSQLFSPFGSIVSGQSMAALEAQQALLQGAAGAAMGGHKADKVKVMSSSNGMMVAPPAKSALSVAQSMGPGGKDGRLTSALFGAQFTAMPRSTKPSELPVVVPAMSLAAESPSMAAGALSLSPHLHPAFLSAAYLPPGPSPMAPQLQMLAAAGGYTPAQLAAYEEMLRQNGFGAFLAAGGPPPAKAARKN